MALARSRRAFQTECFSPSPGTPHARREGRSAAEADRAQTSGHGDLEDPEMSKRLIGLIGPEIARVRTVLTLTTRVQCTKSTCSSWFRSLSVWVVDRE